MFVHHGHGGVSHDTQEREAQAELPAGSDEPFATPPGSMSQIGGKADKCVCNVTERLGAVIREDAGREKGERGREGQERARECV